VVTALGRLIAVEADTADATHQRVRPLSWQQFSAGARRLDLGAPGAMAAVFVEGAGRPMHHKIDAPNRSVSLVIMSAALIRQFMEIANFVPFLEPFRINREVVKIEQRPPTLEGILSG
jgi:hypothetical protein